MISGISSCSCSIKETELANEIYITLIDTSVNSRATTFTLIERVCEVLWEEASCELRGNNKTTSEGSGLHWEAHPRLTEEWMMESCFGLEWADFVCSKATNCSRHGSLGAEE